MLFNAKNKAYNTFFDLWKRSVSLCVEAIYLKGIDIVVFDKFTTLVNYFYSLSIKFCCIVIKCYNCWLDLTR